MVVKTHKRSARSKRSSKKSKSHNGKKTMKNMKVMMGGMPKFFGSSVPSKEKLEKKLFHSQAKQQNYNAQTKKYYKKVVNIGNRRPSQLQLKPLTFEQQRDWVMLEIFTRKAGRRPAKTDAIRRQISSLMSQKNLK